MTRSAQDVRKDHVLERVLDARDAGHNLANEAEIDRSASRTSAVLAGVLALVAVSGLPLAGVAIGLPGVAVVAGGTVFGSRRAVTAGTLALLAGVVYASYTAGTPVVSVLLYTVAVLLAWDAGRYGITVGEQLGRDAATLRIEIAHTAWSATVGLVGLGFGYAAYRLVGQSRSVDALLLLLVGVLVLVGRSFVAADRTPFSRLD